MKIIRDFENNVFNKKSKELGNCFTIIDKNIKYHYEFVLSNNEAKIISNTLEYILDVIYEFRKYNSYITIFYNEDRTFYKAFDSKITFKLPIQCIQPSKFFIDEDRLSIIENALDEDKIFIPVAIINDEYVCLDGHTRLYALYKNDCKMVNVYLDNYEYFINDFIYLAKENNIFNISNVKVLSLEEYEKYWISFCEDYFNTNI